MARGKGEGTYWERVPGKQWAGQITLPDGKRKSFYGPTKADVVRKVNAALHSVNQGMPLPDARQTLRTYLESWLETTERSVKPGTHRGYSLHVKHLIQKLGNIRLAALTAQHLNGFYSERVKSGLSPTTVHHIHNTLHKALEDALDWDILQRNICDRVTPPPRAHHEMQFLTYEQSLRLLEVAEGHRLSHLLWLVLWSGMRIGEALGLRWNDIDFTQGALFVRYSVQETPKAKGRRATAKGEGTQQFMLGKPKTAYARRRIDLSQRAIEVLKTQRANLLVERVKMGAAWKEQNLVFPNQRGGLMIPDNFSQRIYKRWLEKAGLEELREHDLRHTAISLMIARGIHPMSIAKIVGHRDGAFTMRVYGHLMPSMQEETRQKLESLFADKQSGEERNAL